MEIAAGIHAIDTPLGDRVNRVYVLAGEDRCLLFDTAVDAEIAPAVTGVFAELDRPLSDLAWVVISHPDVDHFGGIGSIKEIAPEAAIVAHELDAPLMEDYSVFEARRGNGFVEPWGLPEGQPGLDWMRSVTREGPIDLHCTGGEWVRLSEDWKVQILHVPGHSEGHLAIWDPRSKALLVSDAVLGDAVTLENGDHAFPPTYRFVDSYYGTIDLFERMQADHLLTAHYPIMDREQGLAFLAQSRGFADNLEAAIKKTVAAAGQEGIALVPLLETLNPLVATWPIEGTLVALAFPVVGHLERLVESGDLALIEDTPQARVRSSQ